MSMIAVLGLACAGSVGAMAGALAVAASPAGWRSRLQPLLLAYSAGTLLAAALLGMLPRAFAALPGPQAGLTVLAGFLLLYAIERASVWHHCHDGSCAARRGRGRRRVPARARGAVAAQRGKDRLARSGAGRGPQPAHPPAAGGLRDRCPTFG